jgi:hypothetical protein
MGPVFLASAQKYGFLQANSALLVLKDLFLTKLHKNAYVLWINPLLIAQELVLLVRLQTIGFRETKHAVSAPIALLTNNQKRNVFVQTLNLT